MWPFKRATVRPWPEVAAEYPAAPCGKQGEHYMWEKLQGMRCPRCALSDKRAAELAQEERLASLIAAKVIKALATPTALTQRETQDPGRPE